MTNENVRKQLESRGRQERLEGHSSQPGFDVDKAIARVNDLAQAQAIAQSRRLHPYRLEWIHQLEVRYRDNPGKPVIHLSDLPRKTAIRLSEDGLSMLEELWKSIKRITGTREAKRLGLENIYECGVCRRYTYITLESLHRVRQLIDWSVDSLEQCVTHIKCHKNNWPKEIQPRLPFDFLNEFGVAILGYYTESKHGTAAFTNKDMELHRFVRKAIEQTVGQMRVKTTKYEDVSETYWSLLLRTLIKIAGIDTNPRQKIANNPAPLWLFSTSLSNISAYLRALWTAEGQPESMRVVQSNVVPSLKTYSSSIARHPAVTPFNNLPKQAQVMVRQKPSLLLASAVLLHRSLGIDVGFRPVYAYLEKRNEPTVMWTIELTNSAEINKFATIINFDTTDKQQRLKTRLKTHPSPSPFFLSRTLEFKSDMESESRMLARDGRYVVYASVYHIPPPERRVKAPEIAVIDKKGRLVLVSGGGTVGEYSGRFTKKEARSVVASYLNAFHGDFFGAQDIHIVGNKEVHRLVERGRRGGFHVFVHAENVPAERSLYLKAIYLLELGNKVWPDSKTMEIVRTQGNEDENGLKRLICKHLQKTRKYYVEPGEIHFITEKELAKYEALTA